MDASEALGATRYLVILLSGILIPVALVIWLSVNVSAIRRSQEDIARSPRMTVEEMKSQRLRSPQGRS
jgi:hypothetical protein